jgi:hypothetical protein
VNPEAGNCREARQREDGLNNSRRPIAVRLCGSVGATVSGRPAGSAAVLDPQQLARVALDEVVGRSDGAVTTAW